MNDKQMFLVEQSQEKSFLMDKTLVIIFIYKEEIFWKIISWVQSFIWKCWAFYFLVPSWD